MWHVRVSGIHEKNISKVRCALQQSLSARYIFHSYIVKQVRNRPGFIAFWIRIPHIPTLDLSPKVIILVMRLRKVFGFHSDSAIFRIRLRLGILGTDYWVNSLKFKGDPFSLSSSRSPNRTPVRPPSLMAVWSMWDSGLTALLGNPFSELR